MKVKTRLYWRNNIKMKAINISSIRNIDGRKIVIVMVRIEELWLYTDH